MTETVDDEISLEDALNTNLDIAAPVSQYTSSIIVCSMVHYCSQPLPILVEYRVSCNPLHTDILQSKLCGTGSSLVRVCLSPLQCFLLISLAMSLKGSVYSHQIFLLGRGDF